MDEYFNNLLKESPPFELNELSFPFLPSEELRQSYSHLLIPTSDTFSADDEFSTRSPSSEVDAGDSEPTASSNSKSITGLSVDEQPKKRQFILFVHFDFFLNLLIDTYIQSEPKGSALQEQGQRAESTQ